MPAHSLEVGSETQRTSGIKFTSPSAIQKKGPLKFVYNLRNDVLRWSRRATNEEPDHVDDMRKWTNLDKLAAHWCCVLVGFRGGAGHSSLASKPSMAADATVYYTIQMIQTDGD